MTYGLPCVDLLFILVATLTALRGYRRGLLGLVFELGGGFIGLLAGVALGPRIADATTDSAGLTGVMISLLTVVAALRIPFDVGQYPGLGVIVGILVLGEPCASHVSSVQHAVVNVFEHGAIVPCVRS